MIYRELNKDLYDRRFALVVDMDGELLCVGIYEQYNEAVGSMMCDIWDFSESYKEEGDIFEIGKIESTDNGDMLTVTFKKTFWAKECKEYWHILYCDTAMYKGREKMTPKERQIWYWMREIENLTAKKSTYSDGSIERTDIEKQIKSARITLEQIRSEDEN